MKTADSTTHSLPSHYKSKPGVAPSNPAMALKTGNHFSSDSERNIFHIRQELALGHYDVISRVDTTIDRLLDDLLQPFEC